MGVCARVCVIFIFYQIGKVLGLLENYFIWRGDGNEFGGKINFKKWSSNKANMYIGLIGTQP